MRDKKKGPDAMKQPSPMQAAVATRILHPRIAEIRCQQSLLLFMFVESQKEIIEEEILDGIWEFMEFLKAGGYHIVRGGKNGRERDSRSKLETP